jgi:hypothetical protein
MSENKENKEYTYLDAYKAIMADTSLFRECCLMKKLLRKRKYFY